MKKTNIQKQILAFVFMVLFTGIYANAETIIRKVNIVYIGNSITAATYLETTPPKAAAEYLMDEGYLVNILTVESVVIQRSIFCLPVERSIS